MSFCIPALSFKLYLYNCEADPLSIIEKFWMDICEKDQNYFTRFIFNQRRKYRKKETDLCPKIYLHVYIRLKMKIKKEHKEGKMILFSNIFFNVSLVINNHLWSQANQDVRKGHIYIQGVRKILPKNYISRSFLCMFQYYRGKHTNVRVYTLMFLSSENVLKFCSRQYFPNTL